MTTKLNYHYKAEPIAEYFQDEKVNIHQLSRVQKPFYNGAKNTVPDIDFVISISGKKFINKPPAPTRYQMNKSKQNQFISKYDSD